MSIKVMTLVWEHSRHKSSALLLLLAIADHAHDDGGGAFPAVGTLAKKVRMSTRQVQRLLETLDKSGELRVEWGEGPRGTNRYTVVLDRLGVRHSCVTPDKMSPQTKTSAQGDRLSRRGDIVMSRKPSPNHQQPSGKGPDFQSMTEDERLRWYEHHYRLDPGTLTPVAARYRDADGVRWPAVEREAGDMGRPRHFRRPRRDGPGR